MSYLSASSASSTSVTLQFPSSIVIILRKTEAQGAFSNPSDFPQDGSTYTTTVGAATVVSNLGTAISTYTDTVTAGKYFYKVVAKSLTCYADGAVGQTEVSITPGQTGIAWSYGRSGGSMLKIGLAGDGKIYPSSNGGYVVAVDITGGVESWAPVASAGAQSFQSPMTWVPLSPSPNAVIAADQGGKVYAVNSATGAPLWTEYTTGATAIQAGVAVQLSRYANAAYQTQYGANTDIIFAASNNGAGTITNKLYAIKASDGTCCTAPTWSFNGTVESGTSVAEVTGMPYVDYGRNRIYVASKAAGPAFPTVAGVAYSEETADTTVHDVIAPGGGSSTDLQLLFISFDSNASTNLASLGWTNVITTANSTITSAQVWRKTGIAATFTYTSTISDRSTNRLYRITGWDGTTAPVALGATNGTANANPDPPSLTSGWGAEFTLWFAYFASDQGRMVSGTNYPASFSGNQYTDASGATTSASNVGMGVATRNDAVATEDPGTFTMTASDQWAAVTVAVRPAPSSSRSLWIINSLTGSSIACSPSTDCEMGVLDSSPSLSYAETTLYVGDTAGNLYALENLSGAPSRKWTSLPSSRLALGVGNGNLQGYVWEAYDTPGRLYFTTTTGKVMCVQDNGTSASVCALPWPATPTTVATTVYTPLLMDKLFVGGSDGKVHQIDLTSGLVTRSVNIDLTGCSGSPCKVGDVSTATGNEIFVGSENGKIYKIDLVSGALP